MNQPKHFPRCTLLWLLILASMVSIFAANAQAEEVYWKQGNTKGATPLEAVTPACENYQYCVSVNILPYVPDPSRTDLLTAEYILESGNVWTTKTVSMMSCGYDGYNNCSLYSHETGAGVCEDGFYTDSANQYGYVDTCDRPAMKMCDSGVAQLENGICPVEPPVCTDYEDCLQYAREQMDCDEATAEEYTFIDPQNWSYSCDIPDQPEDDSSWYGCDGEWCGGIDHVDDTSSSSSSSSSQSSSTSNEASSSSSDSSNGSEGSGNSSSSSSSYDNGSGMDGGTNGEASGGESCQTPPQCEGNSVGCATLHQQWLQRCPGAELGDFQGIEYSLDLDEKVQQTFSEYENRFNQIKGDFQSLVGAHLGSGEGRIPSTTHTVHGQEIEIGIAARLDFFDIIRNLIYFGCLLYAFYIIMRA